MDKNSDGSVDSKELIDWMTYVQARYSLNDAKTQFKQMSIDLSANIDFSKYLHNNYGSDGLC